MSALEIIHVQQPANLKPDWKLINLRLPNLLEAIESSPTIVEAENLHEIVVHLIEIADFRLYVKSEWLELANERLMRVKTRYATAIDILNEESWLYNPTLSPFLPHEMQMMKRIGEHGYCPNGMSAATVVKLPGNDLAEIMCNAGLPNFQTM